MAVIIRRDNQSVDLRGDSPDFKPKKNTSLDTILLYIVGFLGLIGSIYLLHLSNRNKTYSQPVNTNTSFFINYPKLLKENQEYRSQQDGAKIIPTTYYEPPKKG